MFSITEPPVAEQFVNKMSHTNPPFWKVEATYGEAISMDAFIDISQRSLESDISGDTGIEPLGRCDLGGAVPACISITGHSAPASISIAHRQSTRA